MAPSQAPSMALLTSMLKSTFRSATVRSARPLTCSFRRATLVTQSLKRTNGSQPTPIASSRQCDFRSWEHSKQSHRSRCFSSSARCAEDPPSNRSQPQNYARAPAAPPLPEAASPFSQLSSWSRSLGVGTGTSDQTPRRTLDDYIQPSPLSGEHHIYVLSHRHNTHVTLTGPQYLDPKTNRMRQDIILTLSSGNIGYRKGQRGSFDAAYQLGSYFLSRIKNDGIAMKIQRLELVLRGFGQGREAFVKLMLGQEGATLRDRVVRVVDATRLKFGGQRAPRPRRL